MHVMLMPKKKAKGTRAKTGCLTCRIRRVKCGEEKPSCLRCTSTGRICDAYGGTSRTHSSNTTASDSDSSRTLSSSSLRSLSPTIDGDSLDKETFHFFRTQCTRSLAGQFDQSFWQRTVLQLGHYEPAVKHSILAVATLLRSNSKPLGCKENFDAVKYYVQGISNLNQYMAVTAQIDPTIILTVCLLFVSFEVIRGNLQGAIVHLNSGLAILKQTTPVPTSAPSGCTAIEELQTLFSRLDIQAATYAPIYIPQLVSIPLLPPVFETIYSMRNALTTITALSHYWLRNRGEPHKYQKAVPEDVLSQQKAIGSLLLRWHTLFTAFTAGPSDATNLAILRVQHVELSIRIATSLTSNETSYDAHNEAFTELVELAAQVIKDRESDDRNESVTFSLDMGLVQSLYFAACKCRLKAVRYHAIALTKRAGREGVWDGDMMSAIALFVVELEQSVHAWASHQGCLGEELPEETQRVHGTGIDINLESRKVNVSCSRRGLDEQWYFVDGDVTW